MNPPTQPNIHPLTNDKAVLVRPVIESPFGLYLTRMSLAISITIGVVPPLKECVAIAHEGRHTLAAPTPKTFSRMRLIPRTRNAPGSFHPLISRRPETNAYPIFRFHQLAFDNPGTGVPEAGELWNTGLVTLGSLGCAGCARTGVKWVDPAENADRYWFPDQAGWLGFNDLLGTVRLPFLSFHTVWPAQAQFFRLRHAWRDPPHAPKGHALPPGRHN